MEERFEDVCTARAQVYAFFARVYRQEPDVVFLEGLRENAEAFEGSLGEVARDLADADIEQVRADAAADFARCFLGMSADPVSPFESVWSSPLHLMMQEQRDQVVAAYRAFGMGKAESFNLPEDHIALELEFMAHLCERARQAASEGDAAALGSAEAMQREFFRRHIDSWAGDMCDKLARVCRTGFYRGIAQATKEAIEGERAYLAQGR